MALEVLSVALEIQHAALEVQRVALDVQLEALEVRNVALEVRRAALEIQRGALGAIWQETEPPCEVATSRRTRRKRHILALSPETQPILAHLAKDLKESSNTLNFTS